MSKYWKIKYKDGTGTTDYFRHLGTVERPTRNEAESALLATLVPRTYPRNDAESQQRHANLLLEVEGYTVVSIVPDDGLE